MVFLLLFLTHLRAAPADPQAFPQAIKLLDRLNRLQEKGVIFGHQDDLVYGYTWRYEDGRSDIKDITGDYPGIAGFELGHIELGDPQSLDDVDFDQIRKQAIKFHEKGGIVTMTWHLNNPVTGGTAWDVNNKQVVRSILPGGDYNTRFVDYLNRLSDFLLTIKSDNGELIPFIFRPYHEHSGDFFWWGNGLCTSQEYIQLWHYTVDFLREKGLHNIIYAYNTDQVNSIGQYLDGYPGDNYVDVLSIDMYDRDSSYFRELENALGFVRVEAKARGKIAALSECGLGGGSDPTFFSGGLLTALKNNPVSWVLIWRHPYNTSPATPGITKSQESDFLQFYNDSFTLFYNEVVQVT